MNSNSKGGAAKKFCTSARNRKQVSKYKLQHYSNMTSPSPSEEQLSQNFQSVALIKGHLSFMAGRNVTAAIKVVSSGHGQAAEENGIGTYAIGFPAPTVRGRHKLQLQIEGIDIEGSPFPLYITPPPEMRGRGQVRIISRSRRPFGLAVDKQAQLIAAEYGGNCITTYSEEGGKVRSLGLKGPCGIAVTDDGHILVTNQHRIQKLTPEGRCVISVGSSEAGSGPLQFEHPRGLAIHPTTGQIYIADSINHRIQVINNDFTYSHSFGSFGNAPGQLNRPSYIAFDSAGNAYIVNFASHCVDVFDCSGNHLWRFGSRGSGEGQLSYPTSITIDPHGIVYITEYENGRISVFNTEGKFIRCIGCQGDEVEFKEPYGVTVDMLGNLYVSDGGNYRIVIL